MKVDGLIKYLKAFNKAKVLVLGDVMMDHFIWGKVSRISPEAPVPVVNVTNETLLLGGAANVVNNITSLGGKAEICGVIGNDDMGRCFIKEIKSKGISEDGIFYDDRPTTVKTRIIAHSQQVVRFDREQKDEISIKTQNNIYETQSKIDKQRNTIGQLISFINKRDKESLLGIILKNNDLSDYFRQTQAAMTVNNNLMTLVDNLQNTENQLNQSKNTLEGQKSNLETLKQQQNAQKTSLDQVTQDKNQLLQQTKGQEAQYQKMLVDVQNQENLFFTQLRELETHVIQGGLYIVHVTASGNLPKKQKGLFQWVY